jgi:prepilin peptidase CpaA
VWAISDFVVPAALGAGLGAAAAIDLRTHRVPNVLTAALALAGLAAAAAGLGRVGVSGALAGGVLGLLVMLPSYVFGRMGAGDVKLFAAAGTFIGPDAVLPALLATAIAGGLLAACVARRRGRLKQTCAAAAKLVTAGAAYASEIARPDRHNRFAFAPAIAAGVVLGGWIAG